MTTEQQFLELLFWIKDHGFVPRQPKGKDLYLCPFTRRVRQYRDLLLHQRKSGLWLPSPDGLRRLGFRVRKDHIDTLVRLRCGAFEGVGGSDQEATLSLLNQIRHNPLAIAC